MKSQKAASGMRVRTSNDLQRFSLEPPASRILTFGFLTPDFFSVVSVRKELRAENQRGDDERDAARERPEVARVNHTTARRETVK